MSQRYHQLISVTGIRRHNSVYLHFFLDFCSFATSNYQTKERARKESCLTVVQVYASQYSESYLPNHQDTLTLHYCSAVPTSYQQQTNKSHNNPPSPFFRLGNRSNVASDNGNVWNLNALPLYIYAELSFPLPSLWKTNITLFD